MSGTRFGDIYGKKSPHLKSVQYFTLSYRKLPMEGELGEERKVERKREEKQGEESGKKEGGKTGRRKKREEKK